MVYSYRYLFINISEGPSVFTVRLKNKKTVDCS